jgi:hypothetical protein
LSSEILRSEYTQDVQVVTLFHGIFQSPTLYQLGDGMGVSVGSVTSIASYRDDRNITIEWLPGYHEDLFETSDSLVIMNNNIRNAVDWLINDTISLELYYFKSDRLGWMFLDYFQWVDLQVAGFFEQEDDSLHSTGTPELILSHQFIYGKFQEENMSFYSDSTSFRVANPLELNMFKEEMELLGFYPLSVTANPRNNAGDTLIVDDSAFVYGASQLMQTLLLLQRFYPVIFVSIGLIIFFISYLMLQSRRQELLIFRLLGVSKRGCFAMYFIEQTVIFILGKIVAVLLSVIFISSVGVRELYPLLIAYLFFSIGCIASLLFMERKSIMIAVSGRE